MIAQLKSLHKNPVVSVFRIQACAEIAIPGRALGHFIFSLIGLKRILFINIFQSFKAPPSIGI